MTYTHTDDLPLQTIDVQHRSHSIIPHLEGGGIMSFQYRIPGISLHIVSFPLGTGWWQIILYMPPMISRLNRGVRQGVQLLLPCRAGATFEFEFYLFRANRCRQA